MNSRKTPRGAKWRDAGLFLSGQNPARRPPRPGVSSVIVSEAGLYLHIPFCVSQCGFCAFYTEPTRGARLDDFVTALERELTMVAAKEAWRPRTIYLGGGTPSILTMRQFERLFDRLASLGFLGEALEEFTVEMIPATVSLDKARLLRERGVNRISMGVQSLDETQLDGLGRVHSVEAVARSFELLRSTGFENINLDLIFAIPGQILADWREVLTGTLAFGPDHVSTYELTYEEGSAFKRQKELGKLVPVDEETAIAMYEAAIAMLGERGYQQYEISNFARPSRRSLHNLNYWLGGDCVAVGPSAAGFWNGTRYQNVANLEAYQKLVAEGKPPVAFSETLPARQRAGELAAFAIRMNEGLDLEWFRRRTGFGPTDLWGKAIDELGAEGLTELEGNRLRLTAHGRLVADSVAERLVILPGEK